MDETEYLTKSEANANRLKESMSEMLCPYCHEACCDCVDGWISVNDRFPPDLLEVMFFYTINENKKDIVVGHYEKGSWHVCYLYNSIRLNDFIKVTHWMPLPKYPK